MKYTVVEMEVKTTTTGKELKKLTLKGEGQENLEPRTTMWDNHPDYTKAVVGAIVNGTLEKKDSGTPIPDHPEKNYVNRTLLPESAVNASTGDLEARVAKLEANVFGTDKNDGVDEIQADDIPFS